MRLIVVSLLAACVGSAADARWVGTWGCAPQMTEDRNLPPAPGLANHTLRQTVHTSIGGKQLRLRFSNVFGTSAVAMNGVSLGTKALSFRGKAAVSIPAGESLMSDVFEFDLLPLTDYVVTIQFGDMSNTVITGHPGSRSTSYIDPGSVATAHWYILTGIDVMADASAIVVIGDSITDGRGSDTDKNNRWTDNLARRLNGIAILNEGLGGNAVVAGGLGPPAVTRIDRDLLGQSSPRWLIVMEGVNDIGTAPRSDTIAAELIAAYEKFIATAHAHGIRAYGVPILPFGKSMYDSPAHEAARQTVNAWIRTSGKFDAVIDMDAAVRDPAMPNVLVPAYDSGDHLHPGVAGYQKMAEIIDLKLFR